MLLVFALTLSANTVFATTNTTTNVIDHNSDQINQTNIQNTVKSPKQQKTSIEQTNMAAGSPTATKQAAGSVSSTKTVSTQRIFTKNQINDAASRVKIYMDRNKKLPSYVNISSVKVTMPQFLGLLTSNVLNTSNRLQTVTDPSFKTQTVKNGKIYKAGYLSMAQSIRSIISSTGKAPGYINTSLGKIEYESLIYTFSKILNYQKTNNRLPNYVTVTAWEFGGSSSEGSSSTSKVSASTSNSALSQYLKATAHAQSNSSTIMKLAASITKGKTTTYAKAQALFNWVRDHLSYSYYYDTKKGALGALSSRSANCVDTSHLVVALARAAGIPARYQHGTCKFSSGWYGHVWAQLYVNGKWYYADAISNSNTFGTIKNWNLKTVKLHGTYASLPF